MAVEPAPIVVEPSGDFLGNDGSWSVFAIEVGNPPQNLKVLASTVTQETLVVLTSGCNTTAGDAQNCSEARGGLYNDTTSSEWVKKNNYALGLEANLGLTMDSDNGEFGYDKLSISTAHKGRVTLAEQLIAGIATKDFFLGALGLSQAPLNFSNPFDSRPSLITHLKNQTLIPSLSYGYTAGASYKNATASLTLGGYDASRLTPNDVSFNLATDVNRELVVALETITFSDSKSTDIPLLTDGILSLVDSTVPTIWLPLSVCVSFESAFGIEYNPIPNIYTVNDTQHKKMVQQNASVTFTLAQTIGSPASVNITLPYASFDLEVDTVAAKGRYFPLRRAADDTQYTLGRAFLQESFLTVDYERKNFSISQTTFTDAPEHIVAISAFNGTTGSSTSSGGGPTVAKTSNHSSHGFPVGAIAGIVIAVILVAFVSGFFTARNYRRSHKHKKSTIDVAEELPADPRYPYDKAEVDGAQSCDNFREKNVPTLNDGSLPGSPGIEIGASSSYISTSYYPMELPGSPPPRSEAPSPEPSRGRAEMASPEPSVHELWATQGGTTEMPSPDLRSTPFRYGSPSPELPSALNSPGPVWPRPRLGPRHSAQDRLSSASSTERPLHDRKDSYDSINPFSPANPSHLRQDSNDSESMITLDRNPSQRTNSDPLVSPAGVTQRPAFHRMNSTEAADTFETRLEGQPSSTSIVGRRTSGRKRESGRESMAANSQLGITREEGLTQEPKDSVDLKS